MRGRGRVREREREREGEGERVRGREREGEGEGEREGEREGEGEGGEGVEGPRGWGLEGGGWGGGRGHNVTFEEDLSSPYTFGEDMCNNPKTCGSGKSIFSLCYLFRNPFSSTTIGHENPIRTLGDYSKPSHEGYKNTIELPAGNNVVPLRPDTIRLVQNGCSFHGLWSEDPNQHLKDFLKLLAIGLNVFLHDPSPHGRILLPDSLLKFFHGKDSQLRNDILMFQQHHGESLSEAWARFKDLLQKVPHHSIDLWLQVQICYDHVNLVTRRTIDQSASGKLCDLNAEESWALLEDLALYDNEIWNNPRDFAKPVKAIALPQDVLSTSDHRLIELKNQVQHLMEAHLAPTQPTQVKKITTSCEICSGPHDTQYCMEDPEQAFVEYASSRTDKAGEEGNPGNTTSNPHPQPNPFASIATEQVRKLNSMLESLGLVPQSSNTKFGCSKEDDGEEQIFKSRTKKKAKSQTKPSTKWKGQSQRSSK
ncbi:MAK10-like protein [Tanacetum coccineum]